MSEEMMDSAIEAEYTLEAPATCSHCKDSVSTVLVVRLLRTRVNFTSALPRRGHVMLCSNCRGLLGGSLGSLL